MRKRDFKYYACDFETTVYDGQEFTEVWLSGCCELYKDTPHIYGNIGDLIKYFKRQHCNIVAYFHNLKFDGAFILSYLLVDLKLKPALVKTGPHEYNVRMMKADEMLDGTVAYNISDRGQWYTIVYKYRGYIIEFRDSLKLLPFSIKEIGKAFNTVHKKLTMKYEGLRYADCPVTKEEKEYFLNDIFVLKEALEVMFDQGHNKLTIGACCMGEFKTFYPKDIFNMMFPDLYEISIDPERHGGIDNAGAWIRKTYRGGWCYLVPEKANRIIEGGITADVNSLYPSMMSSESGNYYPVGRPKFWTGGKIPDEAKREGIYYFIHIRCRFKIKDGFLPFVQIKGTLLYRGTECLKTSDVFDKKTGKYSRTFIDYDGTEREAKPDLYFTCVDFKLFLQHYNVEDMEIIDGCYFQTEKGIFDEYIEKYKKIKLESKGALRTLAKLFLNSLYGKFAASTDSSFKCAYIKDDESLTFFDVSQQEKKPGYIPIGSAITSYARNFTIRAAQKNYHGADKPGFIYADTDSIHCDLKPEELAGVPTHDKDFCKWKLEASWDKAIFVRQKTYIEHVTAEDLKPINEPYYNIKCAGLPDFCKKLLNMSMTGAVEYAITNDRGEWEAIEYNDKEREFLSKCRTMKDFKRGLVVPSKLRPVRIKGGIVLQKTDYMLRY